MNLHEKQSRQLLLQKKIDKQHIKSMSESLRVIPMMQNWLRCGKDTIRAKAFLRQAIPVASVTNSSKNSNNKRTVHNKIGFSTDSTAESKALTVRLYYSR